MNASDFIANLHRQVTGSAGAASGALAQLEQQIVNEQRVLARLRSETDGAAEQLRKLAQGTDAARKAQEALAKAQTAEATKKSELAGLRNATGLAQQADAARLAAEQSKANEAATSRMSAAQSAAAGTAMKVAQALLYVVGSVVGATTAIVAFVAYVGDAARSMRLLNEAATGGVVAGAELTAVVADLANNVPLARGKIAEMARELQFARFAGRDLQLALTAMGVVAAAVGDSAASKIQQIAETSRAARRFLLGARDIYGEFTALAGTGLKSADIYGALAKTMGVSLTRAKELLLSGRVSVRQGLEALEAATQARFGRTVQAQMLALSTQLTRLKENFGALFHGIDLEPFLRGLKSITELFSQSTVTGKALRLIASTVLQPLINMIAEAAPLARAFMQGLIIGTLLVTLKVLELRKWFRDTFGGETASNIDWIKTSLYAGVGAVGALVAVLGLAAIVLGVFAAATIVAATPFILLGVAIYKIVSGVVGLVQKLSSIDLSGAASNMVQSFISGISIEAVVAKMTSFGKAAAGALKAALGIASPSRVALEAAHNVTSTFSGGIEDGKGETRAAFAGMVDPSASGGGSGGGGGPKELHFHYHGGSRDDFEDFKTKATAWYREWLQQQIGEGPLPVS